MEFVIACPANHSKHYNLLIKIWYEAFITTSSYDNYFLPSQNSSNEDKISVTTPTAKWCSMYMAVMQTYEVGMTTSNWV
jgi:hypothetical protein